jgi:hypothetical protein
MKISLLLANVIVWDVPPQAIEKSDLFGLNAKKIYYLA